MNDPRLIEAERLMEHFASATGLLGGAPPRRYLWTDAHAVCNFLSFASREPRGPWLDRATALVEQVHRVLGRHRPDDRRSGWISGLDEADGSAHPTSAGLRIGKPRPERPIGAPFDERGEWEQDGQYYHYLTKWMHALGRVGAATGDDRYLRWAAELAIAAHRGFRARSGPARLYWKMSVDLSYPLVPSSGHHDPLDGLVTALVLWETAPLPQRRQLDPIIDDLALLCAGRSWATDDPLGIGGLLFDASRISQLESSRTRDLALPLLEAVLAGAELGLQAFAASGTGNAPASRRLAFRELGLAIGLQGIEPMYGRHVPAACQRHLDALRAFAPLHEPIERFWSRPESRHTPTWLEHEDINTVMLATSLAPMAFLHI